MESQPHPGMTATEKNRLIEEYLPIASRAAHRFARRGVEGLEARLQHRAKSEDRNLLGRTRL